ncbi:BCS1 N terminal-domain-containing protein, partial [Blyttiomyces helicus]
GLIGVTAGLALLKQAAVHGTTFASRRMLVTLEIPSKDHSYGWFLQWMGNAGAGAGLRPARHHHLAVETSFVRHDNGSSSTKFSLVPGPGKHFMKYKGAWFQVERMRERNMIDLKSGTPWETITLTTLSRDRDLLSEMLEEAKQAALAKEQGKTVIYTSYGPEWRPFGNPRRRRPIRSVVLAEGIADTIMRDVKKFLAGGKWYHDRGIPYRRGYLLYGPP